MGLKFKTGNIPWNTGKPWSEEMREQLRIAHLGQKAWNKGLSMPSVSQSLQGHSVEDTTRDKIRQKLRRGRLLKCAVCPIEFWAKPSQIISNRKYCSTKCMGVANQSQIVSIKQREQIANSRMRDKNPMWKDGRTSDVRRIRQSREMKQWRIAVFKRDDYSCCGCGKRGGNLEADHYPQPFQSLITAVIALYGITSLYERTLDYPPMWDVSNGRTLCKKCHNAQNRETNPRTKLTCAQIEEIRQKVVSGRKQNSVAREYGVTPSYVSGIVKKASL